MKKEKNACPRVDIGGQAVMEGVMMKAPDAIAIAEGTRERRGVLPVFSHPAA